MSVNDNEQSEEKSRTLPIIDKMDKMMPLLDAIDNFDMDYQEPWEISPTVKVLDKIVKEIRAYIKTEFKRELSLKATRGLPKWRINDKSIMKAIGKTRFEDVWLYIQKHTMSLQKSRVLAKGKGWGQHEKNREYVLFFPDQIDMQNSLNLSKSSIQKYLQAFCDSGILKNMGKSGHRGINNYAVGFWSVYGNEEEGGGTRRNYFLKNTREIREALRKFRVKN